MSDYEHHQQQQQQQQQQQPQPRGIVFSRTLYISTIVAFVTDKLAEGFRLRLVSKAWLEAVEFYADAFWKQLVARLLSSHGSSGSRSSSSSSRFGSGIGPGGNRLSKLLFAAAAKRSHVAAAVVRGCFVQASVDVGKIVGPFDETLPMAACQHANAEVLRILLDAHCPPDLVNAYGMSALHECARFGKLDCAALLIEYGAAVDLKDHRGASALLLACSSKPPDDDGAIGNRGYSPLGNRNGNSSSTLESAKKIIAMLLEKNADVNTCNKQQITPLHAAATHHNPALLRMLLATGKCKLEARTQEQCTPLALACAADPVMPRNNAACVQLLLDRGADPTASAKYGATALHRACFVGNAACAAALLDTVARTRSASLTSVVNAADAAGDTALTIAAGRGHVEIVDALIDCRADVNHQNLGGMSALMNAVRNSHPEVVALLLKKGRADRMLANARGETVMQMHMQPDIREMLAES